MLCLLFKLLLPYGLNEFLLKGKAVTTYGWTVSWQIQWVTLNCTVKYSILQINVIKCPALVPIISIQNTVSIYTWIQNNALYHSATKNSEPLPGVCLILACLPCMMPQKFRKFHHSPNLLYAIPLSLCLEPAESSNGKILLIIFQELEHIPTLKKYQRCRQNTFGGDQYGYNEKGSSYNI